jgi:hypothetical protein
MDVDVLCCCGENSTGLIHGVDNSKDGNNNRDRRNRGRRGRSRTPRINVNASFDDQSATNAKNCYGFGFWGNGGQTSRGSDGYPSDEESCGNRRSNKNSWSALTDFLSRSVWGHDDRNGNPEQQWPILDKKKRTPPTSTCSEEEGQAPKTTDDMRIQETPFDESINKKEGSLMETKDSPESPPVSPRTRRAHQKRGNSSSARSSSSNGSGSEKRTPSWGALRDRVSKTRVASNDPKEVQIVSSWGKMPQNSLPWSKTSENCG